ncbi:MAG: hypothetical protein ACK456_03570 [Pseudanabaenaceae cyanobacterium]|jgi:hypothetical protein
MQVLNASNEFSTVGECTTMPTRRTDSAFPISYNKDSESIIEGLTKREYFAAMMMQGLVSSNLRFEDEYQRARLAVVQADALIAILDAE